ncbi:uncharacterized protein LOC106661826 [Cimex lectularius]|uniref:Odorant binding protein n=1 Tax=Cimex lectularius TaxID=79782 RepID=A0A8I6RAQ1_CIMLE|nr:uncharacterized protein LOC106661826 [Cimex lectularius]
MNRSLALALVAFVCSFTNTQGAFKGCSITNMTEMSNDEEGLGYEAKCYIACLFNCTGFITETGELDMEETIAPAFMYFESSNATAMNKTLHECVSRVVRREVDPCAIGYETSLCWLQPMNAYIKILMDQMDAGPLFEQIKGNRTGIYSTLMLNLYSKNTCVKD